MSDTVWAALIFAAGNLNALLFKEFFKYLRSRRQIAEQKTKYIRQLPLNDFEQAFGLTFSRTDAHPRFPLCPACLQKSESSYLLPVPKGGVVRLSSTEREARLHGAAKVTSGKQKLRCPVCHTECELPPDKTLEEVQEFVNRSTPPCR